MDRRSFWAQVNAMQNNGARRGQAIYNVAFNLDPDACDDAVDKAGDPFFDESRVLAFIAELPFDN